jgi:hypothetical protein
VLPLEGELSLIIDEQRMRRVEGCQWVFHRHGKRILRFYKAWEKAKERAGCEGVLFHDFRRTAARNFRRAGLSESEAMAITGHKTAEIFRRYSIVAENDQRDAVWRAQAFIAASTQKVFQGHSTRVDGAQPFAQGYGCEMGETGLSISQGTEVEACQVTESKVG